MNFGYKQSADPLERLQRRYLTARLNLLLVIALTLVNIILLFCGSETYFLFSASIPYYLTFFGMVLTGKIAAEGINPGDALPVGVLIALVAVAVIILAVYFLCFYFGKKKPVWLIIALVLFTLDTIALIVLATYSGEFPVVDLLMHAYVLLYLGFGVYGHFALKKMDREEEGKNGIPNQET